ncbi:MAG: efflux RND transporter periplasmic adaptor subunit [Burkholderiaceae bacterium]
MRLQLSKAQLERSRELVAQGFFSQEALAQRESEAAVGQSEARSNQAQLATAQRQLAKTTLRAPFDGSITARLAQTGEAVAPGSVLFVLTDSRAAEVAATLGPADVPGLRRATDLRLETPAGRHPLRLLRVAATVSVPARTQEARLAFVQTDDAPPAGTSGSLRWTANQPHVPPNLLVRRGASLGVFVKRGQGGDARARFVPLPGAQEGRASALPDSLGADTQIVVRGQAALRDGQAIGAPPQ